MRAKLLFVASFLLASLLPIASAAGAGRTSVTPPRHVFSLLDRTWCVGEVDPYTRCDVHVGTRSDMQVTRTSEPVTAPTLHDALDRLRLLTRPEPLTPLDKELRLHELLGTGGSSGTGVMRR